jgi:hypothetical protein
MKRFFLMILTAAVFFTGLGAMLQQTAAKFKSDEKALAILAKARQAIGGESSIAAVNNFIVTGKSTRSLHFDGSAEKAVVGDMELALQFPDKMMKSVKVINNDGSGDKTVNKTVDVFVMKNAEGDLQWKTEDGAGSEMKPGEAKTIIIKKDDGTAEVIKGDVAITVEKAAKDMRTEFHTNGGQQIVMDRVAGAPGEFPRTNELARTALSLFLTAPQGQETSYTYAGEENIDGTACHVVNAQIGDSSMRLYIGSDSNLPVMVSYQGPKPMVFHFQPSEVGTEKVGDKEVKLFARQTAAPEMAEFQIRFSDFRSVNGLMLPYKWTQTMGGQSDEVIDVTGYEINSTNIGEKFKGQGDTKIFVRKTQ